MPIHSALLTLCLAVAGCAAITDRNSLGYGDYINMSCEQLGQETVRLMRQVADKSEHLLENDAQRKDRAREQLSAVKNARAEKRC